MISHFGKRAALGVLSLSLAALIPAFPVWLHINKKEAELSPFELTMEDSRLASGQTVWVDARSERFFQEGHVTGAILLNEERWDDLLGGLFEAWNPGRTIVVYCDSGCEASHKVAQRLRDLGIEPAYVLKGGIDAWRNAQSRH